MSTRILKVLIGLSGVIGVGLGAFGAHALRTRLTVGSHVETWHTAVTYHLIHTVAALALSVYLDLLPAGTRRPRLIFAAVWCWLSGVLLFSGSLYALSLGGPNWFGPITPVGGLAFLAGWSCVLASGLRASTKQ